MASQRQGQARPLSCKEGDGRAAQLLSFPAVWLCSLAPLPCGGGLRRCPCSPRPCLGPLGQARSRRNSLVLLPNPKPRGAGSWGPSQAHCKQAMALPLLRHWLCGLQHLTSKRGMALCTFQSLTLLGHDRPVPKHMLPQMK